MLPYMTTETLQMWLRILRWGVDYSGQPRKYDVNQISPSKRKVGGERHWKREGNVIMERQTGLIFRESDHMSKNTGGYSNLKMTRRFPQIPENTSPANTLTLAQCY